TQEPLPQALPETERGVRTVARPSSPSLVGKGPRVRFCNPTTPPFLGRYFFAAASLFFPPLAGAAGAPSLAPSAGAAAAPAAGAAPSTAAPSTGAPSIGAAAAAATGASATVGGRTETTA